MAKRIACDSGALNSLNAQVLPSASTVHVLQANLPVSFRTASIRDTYTGQQILHQPSVRVEFRVPSRVITRIYWLLVRPQRSSMHFQEYMNNIEQPNIQDTSDCRSPDSWQHPVISNVAPGRERRIRRMHQGHPPTGASQPVAHGAAVDRSWFSPFRQ